MCKIEWIPHEQKAYRVNIEKTCAQKETWAVNYVETFWKSAEKSFTPFQLAFKNLKKMIKLISELCCSALSRKQELRLYISILLSQHLFPYPTGFFLFNTGCENWLRSKTIQRFVVQWAIFNILIGMKCRQPLNSIRFTEFFFYIAVLNISK